MGWLSRLIGRKPCREELARISQQITKGFDATREEWFRICVRQIEVGLAVRPEYTPILNTELTGAIVTAMKAHQFGSVFSFISSQRYLPDTRSREFWDFLCMGVDASILSEVLELMKEIITLRDDFSRGSHLAYRVAAHVMKKDCVAEDVVVLTGLARSFFVSNNLVAAYAFDDRTTARKLEDILDKCQADYVKYLEEFHNPLAFLESKSAAVSG